MMVFLTVVAFAFGLFLMMYGNEIAKRSPDLSGRSLLFAGFALFVGGTINFGILAFGGYSPCG